MDQSKDGNKQNFIISADYRATYNSSYALSVNETATEISYKSEHNNLNFDVNEQNISKDDLLDADELFFTGTATEVIGVVSVDNTNIGNGSPGEVTNSIRTKYLEIVNGNDDNSDNYLTLVK